MQDTQAVKSDAAVPAPNKKKPRSLNEVRSRAGWIYVAPFILGFLIIYLPIIVDSIIYSFNKINTPPGGGYELEFVGWENYGEALFVDPGFIRTLITSLQRMLFDIPATVIFALFIAILLNQKMVGRAAFRAIFFIPVILSTGIIEKIDMGNILLSQMASGQMIDTGDDSSTDTMNQIISAVDIARLFRGMAIGDNLINYVSDLINNIFGIVNRSGVQMLIFLAGLQSISPSIYESCTMEGASAWETFWKITFPMVSPMILVNAVYTIIDSFTSNKNVVMGYIDGVYKSTGGQEISSAMSWMYFLIIIGIIGAVAGLLSIYVFYQRRD